MSAFKWTLNVPLTVQIKDGIVEYKDITIRRPVVKDYENYRSIGGDIADYYAQAAYLLRACMSVPVEHQDNIDLGADYHPLARRMVNFLALSQWEEHL